MALHHPTVLDAPVPPTLVWGPKRDRKWPPALTVLFVLGFNALAWWALIRAFHHFTGGR